MYLLTVSPDGSISTQTVQSDNSTSTSNRYGILAGGYYQTGDSSSSAGSTNYVGIVIPDGEGGFLATWTEIPDLGNNQAMLTHVSPHSPVVRYPLPFTKGGPFQLV